MNKCNKTIIKESHILHHLNLIEKISNEEPIIIESDGSVYTSSSGRAWPIATSDKDIMIAISDKDTAHESFRKSYRLEAQS